MRRFVSLPVRYYIDNVFEKVATTRVGCHVKWACASIL